MLIVWAQTPGITCSAIKSSGTGITSSDPDLKDSPTPNTSGSRHLAVGMYADEAPAPHRSKLEGAG